MSNPHVTLTALFVGVFTVMVALIAGDSIATPIRLATAATGLVLLVACGRPLVTYTAPVRPPAATSALPPDLEEVPAVDLFADLEMAPMGAVETGPMGPLPPDVDPATGELLGDRVALLEQRLTEQAAMFAQAVAQIRHDLERTARA